MRLLSNLSVLEYLLWLKINYPPNTNNVFIQDLKTNYEGLKVISLLSGKRNYVYEIELNSIRYILKNFSIKRKAESNDLQDDIPLKNEKSDYFDIEKLVLGISKDFSAKSFFFDIQNKVIIMEKLSEYQTFSSALKQSDKNPYLRKYYLGKVASALNSFQDYNDVFSDKNSKNIIMLGTLKKHNRLLELYKDYCASWTENGEDGLIHCDLYSRNIFVNTNHNAIKFIDWEMATLGDPCLDVSIIVYNLCIHVFGEDFLNGFYDGKTSSSINIKYGILKDNIDYLLEIYKGNIKKEKLKTFLIINTQHLSNNVENLIKNIDQVIPLKSQLQ